MKEYAILQTVLCILIVAAVFFMLPIMPGLAVVGALALVFIIYKKWRSRHQS